MGVEVHVGEQAPVALHLASRWESCGAWIPGQKGASTTDANAAWWKSASGSALVSEECW